jgi:hypothetical protein
MVRALQGRGIPLAIPDTKFTANWISCASALLGLMPDVHAFGHLITSSKNIANGDALRELRGRSVPRPLSFLSNRVASS